MSRFYTVQDVAEMFQVCEATVRSRVKDGRWPHWRDGRQIRFGDEDLDVIRKQGQKTPEQITREARRKRKASVREALEYLT